MPAFSTHYLFAKDMMGEIKELYPYETLNEDAVLYGTQGPDFLFFHRLILPGKSLSSVGSAVHAADSSELFGAMADYMINFRGTEKEKETAYSYFCGFILHYALDKAVHPFVYWAQNEYKNRHGVKYHSFILHNIIEFNMDAAMLRAKENVLDARKFGTQRLLSADAQLINAMSRAAAYACSAVCKGEFYTTEQFAQAFRDFRMMQGLINNYYSWKQPAIKALQFPLKSVIGPGLTAMMLPEKADDKFDYTNSGKAEWFNPALPDVRSDKSVDELFDVAREHAVNMIKAFASRVGGESAGWEAFVTGIDFDGKPLEVVGK